MLTLPAIKIRDILIEVFNMKQMKDLETILIAH